jgi:hypothetical protein
MDRRHLMAILAKRGSGTPGTSGTTWANLTNVFDGAPGSIQATYATWTNATNGSVGYIELGGYDFSAIAAGDTIHTVVVTVRNLVNNTARISSVQFQPYDGSTPIGSLASATLNTSAHDDAATFTVTRAQLQSANFKIRVTVTHSAVAGTAIVSLDHVDVTVMYALAGAPVSWVRSGRGPSGTFVDIDVTGGRTLFLLRDQASTTSLSSNNAGVTLLASDSGGPYRNSVWNIAEGTTGTVRITGSALTALWAYVLIDRVTKDAVCGTSGGSTTADMGTTSLTATENQPAVVFWNCDKACDWGSAASGYTALETITTQLNEPSWNLAYSNTSVSPGSYTTPTMSRGKEGTTLTEMIAAVVLKPLPVTATGRPKVWTGTAWAQKPAKVWTGSAWVEKPAKVWTGSTWKTIGA